MYVFMVEHREYLWTEHGDNVQESTVMHPASSLERAERWMVNEAKRHDPTEGILADQKRGRIGWYVVIRDLVDGTSEGTSCSFIGAYDLYGRKLERQPSQLPNPAAETVALERKHADPLGDPTWSPLLINTVDLEPLCTCQCHRGATHMIHCVPCCGPGTGKRCPMEGLPG